MVRDRGRELIEEYLNRVRAYLPLEDDAYITEIRTHLLEEAENIGGGRITEGSALMAIERMGDPRSVANDYAGTGRRIGPIPIEYVRPVVALTVVFVGIGLAFLLGLFLVQPLIIDVPSVIGSSVLIVSLVVISVVAALVVTERLHLIDVRRTEAEKTLFERLLGIGEKALRKKSTAASLAEMLGSLAIAILLILPQVQVLFTDAFLIYVPLLIGMHLVASLVGLLFVTRGENIRTLVLETVLGVSWIVVLSTIVRVGWPLQYIYIYNGVRIVLLDAVALMSQAGFSPSLLWVLAIFIAIVSNAWRVMAGIAKVLWRLRGNED